MNPFRRLKLQPRRPESFTRGKVVIGYPSGGGVTGPFHESLMRLLIYELQKPEPLLYRNPKAQLKASEILGAFGLLPRSGLYVGDNRTNITQRFLDETSAEWLLQIDSDIQFTADLLERMVGMAGADKLILGASVPLGSTFPSCAFNRTEKAGVWWALPSEMLTEEPVACDGLATAVVLIHRRVFEMIADRHGQCWWNHIYIPRSDDVPEPGTSLRDRKFIFQGEDLAFSIRAIESGLQSWCVKVPGLRHYKTLPMSHDHEGVPRPVGVGEDDGAGAEPRAEVRH